MMTSLKSLLLGDREEEKQTDNNSGKTFFLWDR